MTQNLHVRLGASITALLVVATLGACSSGTTTPTTTDTGPTTQTAIHKGTVDGSFRSYEMVKDPSAGDENLSPALKGTGNAWVSVDGEDVLMKCAVKDLKVGSAVTAKQNADGSWEVISAP